MKKTLLSICLCGFLCANDLIDSPKNTISENFILDLNYLKTLPKNTKRDFLINEYLKKDKISSNQAYEALGLISDINNELFYNFALKYGHDETSAVALCMNMENNQLLNSYADCIINGLDLKKASLLSSYDLKIVIQKIKNRYPLYSKKLEVISSSIPFTRLIVQKESDFYDIFFNVDSSFREKYFDYKLPKRTLKKIYKNKVNFEKFLKIVLTNENFRNLNKTFDDLDDENLNSYSSFYLALNAIKSDDYNKAYNYLNNAKNKTDNKLLVKRILFLEYLITKDKTILKQLSLSEDFDLYSYISNELLGKKSNYKPNFDLLDKFQKTLKPLDKNIIALLFAISKSQSNLQIDKVSKDFKVGITQIKPIWIKGLLKDQENYNLNSFFVLEDNLNYAKLYLNSLNIKSKNPFVFLFKYNQDIQGLKKVENLKINKKGDDLLNSYIGILPVLEQNEEFLLWYVLSYNQLEKNPKKHLKISAILKSL